MKVLEIDTWFVMIYYIQIDSHITHRSHYFGYFKVKVEMCDTPLTFCTQLA